MPPPSCPPGPAAHQETLPGHPFPYHHLNKNSAENPGTFTYWCCPGQTVQAFGKLRGSHIKSTQALTFADFTSGNQA